MPAHIRTWSSSEACRVEGCEDDGCVSSQIWFRTEPLDNTFIYRAAQLQLYTDSHDQGFVDDKDSGAWSWFELVILPDEKTDEPVICDGKELVWRSHSNRLGSKDNSRHFGIVFDRRQEILDALEPGNVIGVRVCAQFAGWYNQAVHGTLKATVLDTDLFSPMNWTLSSGRPAEDIPEAILSGVYTVTAATRCDVTVEVSEDDLLSTSRVFSRVWFSSPILEKDVIPRIEDVQLTTRGHDQGFVDDPNAGSWSWFDVAVFDSPKATEPRVKDGRALVWRSHNNEIGHKYSTDRQGVVFDRNHEMLSLLEDGNVIAVCVCARFAGWSNHAESGHLVVRIANMPLQRRPETLGIDYVKLQQEQIASQERLGAYLDYITPQNQPPAYSDVVESTARPWRADDDLGQGKPPLRLLSLDGGGVRGISSLYILQQVMEDIAGDKNAKPCEYFDMIAGTSTGGLIALMLGRLRMSVPDCIRAYNDLAKQIFGDKSYMRLGWKGAFYDENVFTKALQDFIASDKYGKPSYDKDSPMYDPDPNACKVFVLACRAKGVNNESVLHLRTYKNPNTDNPGAQTKIWEAARATSAAPAYFLQQQIGEDSTVDGGIAANNPILLLINEADSFFGPARLKQCVVSLGTGMKPNISFGNGKVVALRDYEMWLALATSGEWEHLLAKDDSRVKACYYRFNAGKKTSKGDDWEKPIDLDKWNEMPKMISWTVEYLEKEKQRVKECASRLPLRLKAQ
ncbi:hypothetical protein CERSUDRAFT_150518 [Gelatoporia subvermispora B]|uniref:PNPLA domain-containing protein n=1 Tax=Ceriporiopsis subvermispora (strain B) TaxID=914234 RepID=M2PT01_CERS8|nr:hypothetical protein CERSUDRAFT_150518 [Gelatoporia subvermispora B]